MREYTVKNLNLYGITPFRRILSPEIFLAAYGKPVRSSTILIPEVVFWLMATVSLTKRSMAGAITAWWAVFQGSLPFLSPHPVTEEAFCMARKKLKLQFFKTIFRSVILRYQSHHGDDYRWRGFRLLGIDGMKMSLPAAPALKKYFASPSNQSGESKCAQGIYRDSHRVFFFFFGRPPGSGLSLRPSVTSSLLINLSLPNGRPHR